MKAQAALVGADSHAVLDAVALVDLHPALVIDPGDTEHDHALGLDQALEQGLLGVLGVLLDEGPEAFHDLGDGLHEFGLAGVAVIDRGEKLGEAGSRHECSIRVRGFENPEHSPIRNAL